MVVLQCSAQLLVIVMVKVDLNKMNLSCPSLAQLIPPTLKHLTFWSSFMKFTNNNGDTITGVLVCKTKKKKKSWLSKLLYLPRATTSRENDNSMHINCIEDCFVPKLSQWSPDSLFGGLWSSTDSFRLSGVSFIFWEFTE